ncbi:MAG: SusC/RagA family TonB-linked outer membrane protein [Bacteroidales bacterium]|nr:SusC/RagA family TonB-linked outer membrane protein [Bacteroidales bacterium]
MAAGVIAYAQTTVKGTVKDAAGQPVIGASVFVQGTHNGTIVELDGSYALQNVKKGDKIEFSCIGYTSQVLVFDGQPINVVLAEDSEMLEGTVVTALGIRKDEKRVGYAVSSVDASKLNATASPSLGSALYGKASGVRIMTAPGGATGAISINVRGLSSITGTSQPLVIVDGVPIRNGEANRGDYWSVQRMESNGLTDINVEDIENLTVLKGASATSLYGSEGANGVVLITMKQGKKNSGVHVDFNASLQADMVAYMPKYQTTFGPAYPFAWWGYGGLVDDPTSEYFGFDIRRMGGTDKNGQTIDVPSVFNAYFYWGPKYDGRMVYTPTGYRPFKAITSNPWSNLFRTAFTQQYNIAITSGNEKGNTRFSYTFMDNTPNQYNSHLGKHNFQISGSQEIVPSVKLGYSVNYMYQNVKNRPYRIARMVANYAGMFGAWDDIEYYRKTIRTSAGFKNRPWTEATHENPSEGWYYGNNLSGFISEYAWNIIGREQYEKNQRLIASVTPSWEIIKGLTLKGNIATDWTNNDIELKEYAETSPILAGSNQGYYAITERNYQTFYGDVLLNYDKKLNEDFALQANVGYSARREKYLGTTANTRNGLTDLNHFHLRYSADDARSSESTTDFLKTAFFATASVSYQNWAYLEGTIRQETTSTLNGQSFWYPSVNGSVILSDIISMPAWVDYAKARVSYGVVGLAPEIYKAAISYSQNTASGYTYQQLDDSIGNNAIKPEKTHEWEFGLEGKAFNNRLGFEASYYHKRIKDQILDATVAPTSGGHSILANVGELTNQGFEFSAYGTPIETSDWRLDLSGNIAWNTNKVVKLMEGLDNLTHSRWDNGAAYLYSFVGEKMGDIYAFAPLKDDKGNYVVDGEGLYKVTDEPIKVGNAMPDLIGGFAASVSYKRWTLDANFNFQIGGDVWNQPYQYMMGLGALEDTMPYRDEAHGGLPYYYDANDATVGVAKGATAGPNGEYIHHDGQILKGVKEDGTPNDIIVPTDYLLEETYAWGTGGPIYYSHSIFKNTYLKCRELTLTYNVPESITKKFKCNNLRVSVFARNPFFIYKNLPIFDAEATDGTRWTDQVQIGGSTSSTRTFGLSLRANF